MTIINRCACCGEVIVGEVEKADPWQDGVDLDFCSAECVEHCEEQHQEYLDSCEV